MRPLTPMKGNVMSRAVKINMETLSIIRNMNYGITPELTKTPKYFVTPDSTHQFKLILSEHDFHQNFAFVGPELYNKFTEVKDI